MIPYFRWCRQYPSVKKTEVYFEKISCLSGKSGCDCRFVFCPVRSIQRNSVRPRAISRIRNTRAAPPHLPRSDPRACNRLFFTNFFFSPFGVFDMVLGTLATLIGAIGTYLLRRRPFLATLPPIVANTLLVPLIFVLNDASTVYYLAMFEILASQIITCIVLGMPFTFALKKAMIAAHIPLPHPSKYDTAPYRRILPGVEEDEED